MKKISKILLFISALLIGSYSIPAFSDVYVKGYYRKDGTYVKPHYRSSPNHTKLDNWSQKGNVNPYTGKAGTKECKPYNCANKGYQNNYKEKEKTEYNRNDYGFKTPNISDLAKGFYTGLTCATKPHADHVVSLKDAHASGAKNWSKGKKQQFANDVENLVPACGSVNISKSDLTPSQFYNRSTDGTGVEVDWTYDSFCTYVQKYVTVKRKWDLSFENNHIDFLNQCFR